MAIFGCSPVKAEPDHEKRRDSHFRHAVEHREKRIQRLVQKRDFHDDDRRRDAQDHGHPRSKQRGLQHLAGFIHVIRKILHHLGDDFRGTSTTTLGTFSMTTTACQSSRATQKMPIVVAKCVKSARSKIRILLILDQPHIGEEFEDCPHVTIEIPASDGWKACAGVAGGSACPARCGQAVLLNTTSRSDRKMASEMECVMNTMVLPVDFHIRSSSTLS